MARPTFDETVGAKEIFGHDETNYQAVLTDSDGRLQVDALVLSGLVGVAHDYIGITYNADNTINVITYKTGGSGGATVATVTLGYTSGNITSVTKT